MGDTSLGAALYGLGDRAGARASLEKAVSLRPLPDTLSNVGFLAYEEKRYDDAAEKFAAPPRCCRRTRDCSGTSAMRS